ncbi:MAG: 50S ribosomal protein L15 [Planctomycetes bacterium]|nr:50S ribosomal protein L15 [Planctomycetota bacterium]
MELAEITSRAGAHKKRRRLGRGTGSGRGKTCGRGHKGGGSRAGWKRRGFAEGGQMPLARRLPKRGFNNAVFTTRYTVVNVGDLQDRFDSKTVINADSLVEVGLVRNRNLGIKILGQGDLSKKLTVEADRFSKQAVEKIAAAGGEARVVSTGGRGGSGR